MWKEELLDKKLNKPVTNPTTKAATAPAETVIIRVSRLKRTTLASTVGWSIWTFDVPSFLCSFFSDLLSCWSTWLITVPILSCSLLVGTVGGASPPGQALWRPVGKQVCVNNGQLRLQTPSRGVHASHLDQKVCANNGRLRLRVARACSLDQFIQINPNWADILPLTHKYILCVCSCSWISDSNKIGLLLCWNYATC